MGTAGSDFGHVVGDILDAAWPDTRRLSRRFVTSVTESVGESAGPASPARSRPTSLMHGAWRNELEQALDTLDAAPITPEERHRLSKDPGAATVKEQLAEGPLSPNDRGTRRLKRGDVRGALAFFSEAIEKDPQHPQPWTKRGIAHARSGKIELAIADYSKALELNSRYLPALANRASASYHVGKLKETCLDCSETIELAPKLAQAYLFRGIARARLGEIEGANTDLYHFLKLSPYSPYVSLIRETLKEFCDWDEDWGDEEDE